MSPQLIRKVLIQDWFVASHLKEMARSVSAYEASRFLEILHGLQNAAAKFIRKTSHHKSLLLLIIYCLILSNNCINYVNCDIEPQPMNNISDDDDDGATKQLNSQKHLPSINKIDTISTVDANNKSNDSNNLLGDVSFLHAFVETISMILFSELGDKTFFIAAIMAMRHPRMIVFAGAIAALVLMTLLSTGFGKLANFIPRVYTYYISTALFAIFGLKMIRDGYYMSATDAQEELEEVQADLKKREDEFEKEAVSTTLLPDVESGVMTIIDDPKVDINTTTSPVKKTKPKSTWYLIVRILVQAFTMTFVAEWGDRSQLSTIVLAARDNAYGVIVGGVLGHAICTGLAVIGGRMIAQRISVRTVTIVGGVVFLLFAFSAFIISPNE